MSDAKSPSELSIDEILTTIRRIIAEDEQAGGQSTTSSGATAATADPATGAGDVTGAPGGDTAGDSDDVLELTEALNEDGTTRHLAPIGGSVRRTAGTGETPSATPRAGPPPEPPPQRREVPTLRRTPEQPAAAPREQSLPRDLTLRAGRRTPHGHFSDLLPPPLPAR